MAALLLGTASCSNDMEPVVADGSEVAANFTLNLGDAVDSRAISDGEKADQLTFYVYENGKEIQALRQTVAVTDKHATVTTKLVKGHTYSFVFWAQNSNCAAYTINNTNDGNYLAVSYDNAPCNDENRDAFYKAMPDYPVTASFTEDVVLTRPFAQLNILATDAASVTDFQNYTSALSCTDLSNTMTVLDGKVGTATSTCGFTAAALPSESLPGYEQYKLVATGYFLASTEKTMTSVDFALTYNGNTDTKTIANVPLQRNYRTNIIGDFFTEGANYNIEIDPMYIGNHDIDLDAVYYEINENSDFATTLETINTDQPSKAIVKIADGVTLSYNIPTARYEMIGATNTKTKAIVFEGAGKDNSFFHVEGNGVQGVKVTNGALVTFKNLTITDDTRYNSEDGNNAWEFAYLEFEGKYQFENVKFADGIQIEGDDSEFDCVNCDFISDGNPKRDAGKQSNEYAVWICSGKLNFTNCDFTGYRGPKIHEEYGSEVTAVYFDGCTFHDITKKPGIAVGRLLPEGASYTTESTTYTLSKTAVLSIKNCTFRNTQPGDQGYYKYETDSELSDIIFTDENNTVEH